MSLRFYSHEVRFGWNTVLRYLCWWIFKRHQHFNVKSRNVGLGLFIVRRAYIPSQSRTDIVNRHPSSLQQRIAYHTKLESDISFMVSKEDELARAIQTFTLFVALLELRNATFDSVRLNRNNRKRIHAQQPT
jgi:hypothetical protein